MVKISACPTAASGSRSASAGEGGAPLDEAELFAGGVWGHRAEKSGGLRKTRSGCTD